MSSTLEEIERRALDRFYYSEENSDLEKQCEDTLALIYVIEALQAIARINFVPKFSDNAIQEALDAYGV